MCFQGLVKLTGTHCWGEAASFSHLGAITVKPVPVFKITWNQFNSLVFPMIFYKKKRQKFEPNTGEYILWKKADCLTFEVLFLIHFSFFWGCSKCFIIKLPVLLVSLLNWLLELKADHLHCYSTTSEVEAGCIFAQRRLKVMALTLA